MTEVELLDTVRHLVNDYKVGVNRSQGIGGLSSERFSRPADERHLSLSELFAAVRGRSKRSQTRTMVTGVVRVDASRDDAERLTLTLPSAETPLSPTHWSVGPLASLVAAPASYLRQIPAPLAGINLQYGLTCYREERIKTLEIEDGRVKLRAVTGPDYGRIFDHELVFAVHRIGGNGTGDASWKVPGILDWLTGVYNLRAAVTQDPTTLYASGRDIFLLLVDESQSDRGWPAARPLAGSLLQWILLR